MNNAILKQLSRHKSFIVFILLMSIFRSAFADWYTVPSGSMQPTIVEGDRILANKMAYDIRVPFTHISLYQISNPKRGDIIIFDSAKSGNRLVKRVVGLPGDIIKLTNNQLYINGETLPLSYISSAKKSRDLLENLLGSKHLIRISKTGSPLSSFDTITVPENYYLVLGDNRDNSSDSRVIGLVPRHEIIGRTNTVIMSFNYNKYYTPRFNRFFYSLLYS